MQLQPEELNKQLAKLEDPNDPINIEIAEAYPELTKAELLNVINSLNTQAFAQLFTEIVQDFNEEQRQKYQEFLNTKPTPQEAGMILLYGYYLKYGKNPADRVREIRKGLNKGFINRREKLKLIAEKIATAEDGNIEAIAKDLNNGYYLHALAKLRKLFR